VSRPRLRFSHEWQASTTQRRTRHLELELLAARADVRGDAVEPTGGVDYQQLIDGGQARALLGPHTQLVQTAERGFRVERGTAMIEANALHVVAGAVELDLDGYAIVSLEPSVALQQVTLVTRSTHEGDTMRARLNDYLDKAPIAAAGAMVAVWMVNGEARAHVAGQPPVTVRAGQVYSPPAAPPAVIASSKTPAVPAKAALKEGCTDCVPMPPPPERTIVEGNSPKRGPAVAPVTIVEFTDYECPFCRKFSDTVLTLEKLCARHSSSSMAGRWSGRSRWRISSRSSTKSSPRKSVRALQTL